MCGGVQVADIEKAEKEKMRAKVENIISQGLNCFVNRQLIYNFPEEIFADAGVMAIEHADFDGIERLALVTGHHPISCHPVSRKHVYASDAGSTHVHKKDQKQGCMHCTMCQNCSQCYDLCRTSWVHKVFDQQC